MTLCVWYRSRIVGRYYDKCPGSQQFSLPTVVSRSFREVPTPKSSVDKPSRTIAFNKPYGVLPCFTDPEGRSTLGDYIKAAGVYAAGRLDLDSEGLMILTSDGALAHRITDPKHKLPKVYLAQVERIPNQAALDKLRKGIVLSGKRTKPAEVRLLSEEPTLPDRPVPIRFRRNVPVAWIEITLHEGMNRQVRRMTAAVGHPTLRLVRVAIGPMSLGDLQPGHWRKLSIREVEQMTEAMCSVKGFDQRWAKRPAR